MSIDLRILRKQIEQLAPGQWAGSPRKIYEYINVDVLQFRQSPDNLWTDVPIVEEKDA